MNDNTEDKTRVDDVSLDERFKRIAWSIATSTASETCESPHEIYRRLMVRHQERTQGKEQSTN
jgi:hypothetical protein